MNANEPVVLGIDVGGTKVLVGYVGREGMVYRSRSYPMDRSSQETTLYSIRSALDTFMQEPWNGTAPLAIGFGVVGQTDPASGTWVHAMNVPISTPAPLAAEFGARFGVPVALDNDVHAATLAELHLGAGKKASDFIYVNIGTGLAAGIVCNRQLVRGASNYAGELGHMVVEPEGEPCPCGRRGCLEPIASGGGIIAQVRGRLPDYPASSLHTASRTGALTSSSIFQAADAGDPLASVVAKRVVSALGAALTNLLNLLNPEIIVLGGGVVRDEWLVSRMESLVTAQGLPAAVRAFQGIVPSRLRVDQVGLLGAAVLAWSSVHNEVAV